MTDEERFTNYMKWWYWVILELLIIFGVMAWIYFFPSDFEYAFAKGMVGFVLIYTIEDCKDIKRWKTMDCKGVNMFEKESEIYALSNFGFRGKNSQRVLTAKIDYQYGAEFGYNKANEWHYVKDEKDVEVLYQDCDKTNVYNCIYDIHAENWLYYNLDNMVLEPFSYHVIAWKEIVLPKEIKEND